MMKPTENKVLIKKIENKKEDSGLILADQYILAEVLDVGADVKYVKKGDIALVERGDIKRLTFKDYDLYYVFEGRIQFYEDGTTKEKKTGKTKTS